VNDVLVAVGQEERVSVIERDIGLTFTNGTCRWWTKPPFQSTEPRVFFGGDSAFGPKNIISGRSPRDQAAISIHQFCQGADVKDRPPPMVTSPARRWHHEWSYDNGVSLDLRFKVPHRTS